VVVLRITTKSDTFVESRRDSEPVARWPKFAVQRARLIIVMVMMMIIITTVVLHRVVGRLAWHE
jgi:hypothetical protein